MDLAALKARAAAENPMASAVVPILHGRTLNLDGDGLAYYCAGNDSTTIGEARSRVRDKVDGMQRAASAEKVRILLTASGSHKGHRYALARVKPYQGQRSNSKRPKNWQALRDMLESGTFGPTMTYGDREADDGFGFYGHSDPRNNVHGTQDKDMRMVPGWHIDWKDNRMTYLAPRTYSHVFNDLQYGIKWFWLQMLHGDTADYIPGLPKMVVKGVPKLVGPVTAEKLLAHTENNDQAAFIVSELYRSFYKERWLTEMAEQACLLWMRGGVDADWFEAMSVAGPLGVFGETHPDEHYAAWQELTARVKQAQELNDLSSQSQ